MQIKSGDLFFRIIAMFLAFVFAIFFWSGFLAGNAFAQDGSVILSDIEFDGHSVFDLSADKTEYTVQLPYRYVKNQPDYFAIPTVVATPKDKNAKVEIVYPDYVEGGIISIFVINGSAREEYKLHIQTVGKNLLTDGGFEEDNTWKKYPSYQHTGFEYRVNPVIPGERSGYMQGPRTDAAFSYRQYVNTELGKTYIASGSAMHETMQFGVFHTFTCNNFNVGFHTTYWNELGGKIAGVKQPHRLFTIDYEFNRGFVVFDAYTKDGNNELSSDKVSYQLQAWDKETTFYVDDHFYGELCIADVNISSNRKTVYVPKHGAAPTEIQLKASFTNQFGNCAGLTDEKITDWKILGNPEGITISDDGIVYVSDNASPGKIIVEGVVEPSFLSPVQEKTGGRCIIDIQPTAERTYLFSDDFQGEQEGTSPSNWSLSSDDVSDITVVNEDKNKFARISVNNQSQIMARTNENVIDSSEFKNKCFVIEGKVRSNENNFVKNICVNFPVENSYENYENHHALFQMGKGEPAYFGVADYKTEDGQPGVHISYDNRIESDRWYDIRIIVNPILKRAAYYVDSRMVTGDGKYGYLTSPELQISKIDNIAFLCKDAIGSSGYLDFDDIKVYTIDSVEQPDSAKIEGEDKVFIPENGVNKQNYSVELYSQTELSMKEYIPYDVKYRIAGDNLGTQIDDSGCLSVPSTARQGKITIEVTARPWLNEDVGLLLKDVIVVTLAGCNAEIQYEVQYESGTEKIIDLRRGNIYANVKLTNGNTSQDFFIAHALYEKNGTDFILNKVVVDAVGKLNANEYKNYKSSGLTVENPEKQIIKTFVWNQNLKPLAQNELLKESIKRCEIYVAPDGNDYADGSLNSPLATVVRARDKIRYMKLNGGLPKGGVTVYIRGGEYHEYFIPLVENDSGSEDSPIVYRAYDGETPVFVGGVTIPEELMKPISNQDIKNQIIDSTAREEILEVNLSALGITQISDLNYRGTYGAAKKYPADTPNELSVDGEPMQLAKYPNDGYMTINQVISPGNDSGNGMIIDCDSSRMKYWKSADDLRIYGLFYYNWADESMKVKNLDENNGTIETLTNPSHGVRTGQHFYIYNTISELDIPGEYYIDRTNGMLYFYPPEDSEGKNFHLSVQNWTNFWLHQVKYITLDGLRFTAFRGYGVNIMNSDYCVIKNCKFDNLGNYAVVMNGIENRMENCDVHDVNGGVWINKGSPSLVPFNNLICNNRFVRCDRLSKTYSPAVLLGGVGNVVCHNEISEADHQVIYFDGNENIIEYNEIYDVCRKTDDASAIYTGGNHWSQRGNQIRYNYIHDINSTMDTECGVYGVYLDGQACGNTVYGNVFENIDFGNPRIGCWGGSVHVGGGKDNKIENNILIRAGEPRFTTTGVYVNPPNTDVFVERLESLPYREEPWKSKYPELYSLLEREDFYKPIGNSERNNVYYDTDVLVEHEKLEIANLVEYEGNLIYSEGADPGFLDITNRNYELRDDSEVYIKNPDFNPILFSLMGRNR